MTGEGGGRVVVVTVDLMDRTRLAGALPGATVVRPGALAAELAASPAPTHVVVDLAAPGALDAVAGAVASGAAVVVFGPHVQEDALAAAEAAGAVALPRSVAFRRLGEGTLLDAAGA